MDELTRKRVEQNQLKEAETSCELQYIEYYHAENLKLTYEEILRYGFEKGREGVCWYRTMRLFIDELCDSRFTPEMFNNGGSAYDE